MIAGAALGLILGLLAAIPGVHVSVILVSLLPALGLSGDFGASLLIGATGSGLIATNLAKTFHPVTNTTVQSATPEQALAYRGEGLRAIYIQNHATWVGALIVLFVAIPMLALKAIDNHLLNQLVNSIKPISWLLLLAFVILVIWQARRKLLTAAVIATGSLLGFWAMNHPALAGNSAVLAPLLGGVFTLPGALLVLTQTGRIQRFPQQRQVRLRTPAHEPTGWGAIAGILTALTAGLGSGAAISLTAKQLSKENYLAAHTSSEAANHVFAVLLVLTLGVSHSGIGISLKQLSPTFSWTFTIAALILLLLGLRLAEGLSNRMVNVYATWIARVPQRFTALGIAVLAIAIVYHETGLTGCLVAATATALGLAARTSAVPNQALASVLTGPILITSLGLAHPLAQTLGLLH